jgi:predicted transcriptional regulator
MSAKKNGSRKFVTTIIERTLGNSPNLTIHEVRMKKIPPLSAAEQALMDLIWKHQPVAVSELLEQVNQGRSRQITRNTLQTQLTRLEAKGWLKAETGGRARLYRSAVPEQRGRNTILSGIKERLFGGSGLSLIRCLVEQGDISDEEMKELGEWIETRRNPPRPPAL